MGDLSKNFSQKEVECPCCKKGSINHILLNKLQNIRDALGVAITINSCFRCAKRNRHIEASKTSSHLKGLAADILCLNSRYRFDLIHTAIDEGIKRIGVYETFVHFDIDAEKSDNIIWVGKFKAWSINNV